MKIILASKSPRRKELLTKLLKDIGQTSINFEIMASDIEETQKPNESPLDYAKRLAKEKAEDIFSKLSQSHSRTVAQSILIIAADTIVVLSTKIFGKPTDKQEAIQILTQLSGQTHEVTTAYAILRSDYHPVAKSQSRIVVSHDTTQVTFKPLTRKQIEGYVNSNEPMDKAGAYGIQGGAKDFVAKIEGSYSNVVGLPLEKLTPIIKNLLSDV